MRASKQAAQPPARSTPPVTTTAAPVSSCSLQPARSGDRTLPTPLAGRILQTKLQVGRPDDPLEHEADRIADQVLRMPDPDSAGPSLHPAPIRPLSIQRRCAACEDEELQRKIQDPQVEGAAPPGLDSVAATLHRSGRALDPAARAFFEPRFGADFSAVRVHTDSQAAASARAINALAYTVGNNVVFNTGQYAPHHDHGKRLLAHELTHVVQQSGSQPQDFRSAPATAPATVLRQVPDGSVDDGEEPPLSRPQEIALSHSSPGEYTGQANPLTLSLFNFGIDIATPKTQHRAVLQELGRLLGARATVRTSVRVIGFADSTGDERHNLRLSARRAASVKATLEPLVTQRVSVAAYGETNPVAGNDTVSGRSRNRRVDIRFAVDRPVPPQPLPRPRPRPPGGGPGPIPIPEPPGAGGGGEHDDTSFCLEYPLICAIGIPPFLAPLLCLVAPEVCAALVCLLSPELCVPPIPPTPPQPPEPPEEPDDDDDGRPRVHFVPAVRAANTPAGMPDRIGLRDPVQVTAVVVNPPPIATPIVIAVDGVGPNGGVATVNGAPQVQIGATTPLEIRGTAMSASNFAFSPFLELAAWWANDLVGESNRFAVSSILEDWTVALDGSEIGPIGTVFWARMDWVSDSNAYRDLDECRYVELVGLISESGGMVGLGTGGVNDPNDVVTGDFHPTFDQHGTPYSFIRRAGRSRLKQLFRIRDMRTNSGWVASSNSGFEIERLVERDSDNPRCWQLTVKKFGAPVSIGGLASAGGAGSAEHTFHHLNCDPPPPGPEPDPTPEPVPEPTPVPDPTPRQQTDPIPPCDRVELSRRVDECIEQARQDAIDCTLGLVPFSGGIGGVLSGLDYLACLEELKARLLACDRKAKRDTHCEDGRQDSDEGPRLAQAAGLPPSPSA